MLHRKHKSPVGNEGLVDQGENASDILNVMKCQARAFKAKITLTTVSQGFATKCGVATAQVQDTPVGHVADEFQDDRSFQSVIGIVDTLSPRHISVEDSVIIKESRSIMSHGSFRLTLSTFWR